MPVICMDFCARVLRRETALDYINDHNNRNDNIHNIFKDKSVCAAYANYRNYQVHGVETKIKVTDVIPGLGITYVKYMKDRYNKKIYDLKQPLLIHIPRRKKGELKDKIIHLIPELCQMTGLE